MMSKAWGELTPNPAESLRTSDIDTSSTLSELAAAMLHAARTKCVCASAIRTRTLDLAAYGRATVASFVSVGWMEKRQDRKERGAGPPWPGSDAACWTSPKCHFENWM